MERVFYFSGYRMTVFDWDQKTLVSSEDFQPDEDGFEDFEYLLSNSMPMPARLVVDMIEEDFRRETVPHVNLFDRGAVIERLLDRHYRDEDFVNAKVIGRSSEGRRDDRVLLSALTNPGLLDPWLERMKTHDVKLAGIWSLPLLTEKLLKQVLNDDEHALVVSRQVRSALRNSYFQEGKLVLSRQAKFDREMWDKEDFHGVIQTLERASTEIYNFLINQRIMRGGDQLNVYCILDEDQLSDARELSNSTQTVSYSFLSLEQLLRNLGVQGCGDAGAAALFAYLSTKTNPFSDHYATPEQKSTYHRYLMDKSVTHVAEVGSLICVTIAVFFALSSMELGQENSDVTLRSQQLQLEYSEQFGEQETRLQSAEAVRDSVRLLGELEQDAGQAPHRYFASLSKVLSQPEFTTIRVVKIQWDKYSREEVAQLVEGHEAILREQNNPYEQDLTGYYEEDEEPLTNLPRRKSVLTLNGKIDTLGYSYRSTITKMRNFVENLEALPEVERVLLIRTAVDVRDASRFSDQVGNQDETDAESGDNVFEILVVLEAPQHA